ncbi:hypothetical protein D187_008963 [Cystobacter fuscus DSM 2262]|uniref:Uncharacterized protein n=1 Tax=Cystobacter fuscus (strain ATCC 25194 / DSM 2262 / NBRC 100088 / M29) TaxID=1242864 RepID=S9PEG2_CYSF2|nr:hypothetical protein D187_008963 [Cystobacter fuscus DSM 2262]
MRLRLVLWGSLLTLQVLATAFPPEAIAPAVAGSVYLPLMALRAVGLPVFGRAESGGWPGPSPLGWILVATFWAAVWWGVVSLAGRLARGPSGGSESKSA